VQLSKYEKLVIASGLCLPCTNSALIDQYNVFYISSYCCTFSVDLEKNQCKSMHPFEIC